MDVYLTRNKASLYGIFGQLSDVNGAQLAVTLEHAYADGAAFVPKLASGTYKCIRHEPNRLPYVTFMVTGVPDFQGCAVDGILIHRGNYNKDSEGCILLGVEENLLGIGESEIAFNRFMDLQKDVDEFTLVVS